MRLKQNGPEGTAHSRSFREHAPVRQSNVRISSRYHRKNRVRPDFASVHVILVERADNVSKTIVISYNM